MKTFDLYLNNKDTHVGKLHFDSESKSEACSFEYDPDFLINHRDFFLDPEIEPYLGLQFARNNSMFSFLNDLMPDRWGRNLLNRNERYLAKIGNRRPRTLRDFDYLLGVEDISRMGAIRLVDENGNFLAKNDKPVPPILSLRKLEQASLDFEDDFNNDELVKLLLSPGSSLGGARPKATITGLDNELYIAKFPSKKDEIDVGLWEQVVMDLANLIGLNTPETRLEEKKNKYGSIFLTKRFDREGINRFHYASLMTLLNAHDDDKDKHSYLEIFNAIKQYSSKPKEDTLELFKRIIFFIVINNTDDHLRNHGFIYKDNKWRLSPLFDVNITTYSNEHALNFVNDDVSTLDNARDIGAMLGYNSSFIEENISLIVNIVKDNIVRLAKRYKAKQSEIDAMLNIIVTK